MIYHFADPEAWEKALDTGFYKPPSLLSEGFVHCCFKEQLESVARRHFPGQSELLTLHVVEKRIKQIYKEEYVEEAGEKYPHVYGPLPILAVQDVSMYYPAGAQKA